MPIFQNFGLYKSTEKRNQYVIGEIKGTLHGLNDVHNGSAGSIFEADVGLHQLNEGLTLEVNEFSTSSA